MKTVLGFRARARAARLAAPALALGALLVALAAPVRAQSFGQGFVHEIEPNGTAATATPLGGTNVVADGQIVTNPDVDYWSFSVAGSSRVYAAVVTSSSAQSLNSQLDLLGTDGATVIESDLDDGSLGSTSSSIAGATLASAGTYFLRVKAQTAGSSVEIRPYRLYLRVQSGSPDPEIEPNNPTPQALPPSGWIAGNLDAGEIDLYSVVLGAGDTVYASLDADPERDGGTTYNPRLGLVLPGAPNDPLLADDPDTTSPNSEAFVATVQSAGTYTLYVDESTGAGGAAFTYGLSVSILPASAQGESCTTYSSTDVPQSIATGPGQTLSTITIPGSPRIADLDLHVELDHAQPADLDVHLRSPAGNDDAVATDLGSSLFPNWNVTFDDESAVPAGSYNVNVFDGLGLAPEGGTAGYRLDWFDGEDAGGDWTLVLDDDTAGNSGQLTAWSLRICEPPPLPACPGGSTRQSVLATDFEGGAAGFSHSGTQDEWQLGLPSGAPIDDCASGSSCWDTDLTGSYNNSSDQTLLSPAVDLTGALGPVVVSWAQKYQMENATFDHFTVTLGLTDQPAGAAQSLFAWSGPDMSSTVGSTTLKESAGWGVMNVAADAGFVGQLVELRFRLTSDSSNFGGILYDGAAIDDVDVTACIPDGGPTSIFADGFASGTLCVWSTSVGGPGGC